MKLRTLLIDDEPLAHDIILDYAKDVPFLEVAGQCYLATDALDFLAHNTIDLIFLDIRIPRLNGLDFLRTLRQQPIVIITSAYEEYALESYELNVCDYLHKPFRFERFLKAANKSFELHQLRQGALTSPASPEIKPKPALKQLLIKSDKRLLQLDLQDVYFLESFGNYVKVWLCDKYYLTMQTLSSFESQLPPELFLRIHKSFIINKAQLAYQEGNMAVLKNKKELPIGKNYRQTFKQQLSA